MKHYYMQNTTEYKVWIDAKAILQRNEKSKKMKATWEYFLKQIFTVGSVQEPLICFNKYKYLSGLPSYNQSAIPLKIIPSFPEDVRRNELLFTSGW